MNDITRKLIAQANKINPVEARAIGNEFDAATQAESNRLLLGFFNVIKGDKAGTDRITDEQKTATIYAAIAMMHSMRELIELREKADKAYLN